MQIKGKATKEKLLHVWVNDKGCVEKQHNTYPYVSPTIIREWEGG